MVEHAVSDLTNSKITIRSGEEYGESFYIREEWSLRDQLPLTESHEIELMPSEALELACEIIMRIRNIDLDQGRLDKPITE